ncbi:MAG: PH domain-containing protein [Muribaculaceae bacterium]|nr:PH domain-containing protein [Muribaculaceae bacterium]MBR5117836.1 PH domain-containing protein [Muribaculaceae bacterium]
MGYIQKNLMSGEFVAYEAKQHGIIYTWPVLLALLSFGAFFIPIEKWWINACICLVVLLIALFWAISIYGGRQYVVTNNRLIFKRGIINRSSHELLLKKCEGVQVDQSIPGRIFDYGTVMVTTGEVTNSYKYISHPLRFSTSIHEQISHLKDD